LESFIDAWELERSADAGGKLCLPEVTVFDLRCTLRWITDVTQRFLEAYSPEYEQYTRENDRRGERKLGVQLKHLYIFARMG